MKNKKAQDVSIQPKEVFDRAKMEKEILNNENIMSMAKKSLLDKILKMLDDSEQKLN